PLGRDDLRLGGLRIYLPCCLERSVSRSLPDGQYRRQRRARTPRFPLEPALWRVFYPDADLDKLLRLHSVRVEGQSEKLLLLRQRHPSEWQPTGTHRFPPLVRRETGQVAPVGAQMRVACCIPFRQTPVLPRAVRHGLRIELCV